MKTGAGEEIRTLDPNLGKNSGAPAKPFQSYDTTLLNQLLIDIAGAARKFVYATKRPHGGILVVYWERDLPWVHSESNFTDEANGGRHSPHRPDP